TRTQCDSRGPVEKRERSHYHLRSDQRLRGGCAGGRSEPLSSESIGAGHPLDRHSGHTAYSSLHCTILGRETVILERPSPVSIFGVYERGVPNAERVVLHISAP